MRTIFKYPLKQPLDYIAAVVGPIVVPMHRSAKILAVGLQNGEPVIWARVDSEAPMVNRNLLIIGTGRDASLADGCPYIGTYQREWFVGHLFDMGE